MKALGYVRVSTDRQALSLEAQEAKIRAMATVQGADLEDVIVDGGESAKSLNAPGLQRLIGLVIRITSAPRQMRSSSATTTSCWSI